MIDLNCPFKNKETKKKPKKQTLLTISLIFTILQKKNENTFGRLFKRVGFTELP